MQNHPCICSSFLCLILGFLQNALGEPSLPPLGVSDPTVFSGSTSAHSEQRSGSPRGANMVVGLGCWPLLCAKQAWNRVALQLLSGAACL